MIELGARTKLFAIDIETVSQGGRANDYTDQRPVKLGNVKDPVKIEAKLKEKREEARTKHALNWWTGSIVSIAMIDCVSGEEWCEYGHNEEVLLFKAAQYLNNGNCKLIGKTSKNFDFPYLVGRYMANGMTPPKALTIRNNLYDMDDFFGFSSTSGQRGSLADYSHGLGYDGKLMDGSGVAALYADIVMAKSEEKAAEGWRKLADYNLDDTRKVADAAALYWGLR